MQRTPQSFKQPNRRITNRTPPCVPNYTYFSAKMLINRRQRRPGKWALTAARNHEENGSINFYYSPFLSLSSKLVGPIRRTSSERSWLPHYWDDTGNEFICCRCKFNLGQFASCNLNGWKNYGAHFARWTCRSSLSRGIRTTWISEINYGIN